jgi:dTDP-4-amino-4,6-dideoxygalactose transaminase
LRSYLWFALRFGIEATPRALPEYLGPFYDPVAWTLGENLDMTERMSASASLAVRAQVERLRSIVAGRTAVIAHYLQAVEASTKLSLVQATAPRYLSRILLRWSDGPSGRAVRESLARHGYASRMPYPIWTADDDPTASFTRHVMSTHLELPGSPRLRKAQVDELVSALSICLDRACAESTGIHERHR